MTQAPLPARIRSNQRLREFYRRLLSLRVRLRLLVNRKATVPGLLDVFVIGDGPEAQACARAIREQRYADVDITLVADGSTSEAIVNDSRGEFLTFVDARDSIQRDAYVAAIAALRRTGSDFAVLAHEAVWMRKKRPASHAVQVAHAEERLRTTLPDFPQAQANSVSAAKILRRSFWQSESLSWDEELAFSTAVFVHAQSFDVLTAIGVTREGPLTITDPSVSTEALKAHTAAALHALGLLDKAGADAAATARTAQLLNELRSFLIEIPRGDDAYWATARATVAALRERLSDTEFASHVDAPIKVMAELIAAGRRDDLREFLVDRGDDVNRFPTGVTADGIESLLPVPTDLAAPLFADDQLTPSSAIVRATWADIEHLELTGWAYIAHLDLATNDTSIVVETLAADGTTQPLSIVPISLPVIDEYAPHSYCDYRPSGFRATIDTRTLAGYGPWTFRATIDTSGVRRSTPVLGSAVRGAALTPLSSEHHTLRRGKGQPIRLESATAPTRHDGMRVSAMRVDGDRLIVTLDGSDETVTAVLSGPAELPADIDGGLLSFELSYDDGRLLAVDSGTYKLLVGKPGAKKSTVPIDPAILALLPFDELAASVRVRALPVGGSATLSFAISTPLTVDERGPRNQQRLRDESRVDEATLPAAFFRSLYGEVTNCNGRAVHHELLRRGAAIELFWSIRDRAVAVPPGGTGLVEGSAEWHRIIASAKYQMVNVHQFAWFRKPKGQAIIQTMHGFPYKVMGHGLWESQHIPWTNLSDFDRRARDWDYFVSPASYATPLLETAFLAPADAHPTILEIGYPRNDALLTPAAADVRARTREALGIRDDQIAVMYAPTFRDYLAVGDMKADYIELFDAAAAADKLGPDFVFLMRGHPFNARSSSRPRAGSHILDVTDFPEINDLCLASDAAILDYSSLRFDYALTGKPMIFLVPDLDAYNAARGGVIPFEPTAPGPHADSTDEVIAELADFPSLIEKCREDIEHFRHEYVDLDDGDASARLVDAVFAPRGDASPK